MHHHQDTGGGKVALAFIAGAATALAAGGYYLFGPKGRTHRAQTEWWIEKTKTDVLSRMQDIKDMTEEKYHQLVDTVVDGYAGAKELTFEQAEQAKEHLQDKWDDMRMAAHRAAARAEEELRVEEEVESASGRRRRS